jgi:hypothetical protein
MTEVVPTAVGLLRHRPFTLYFLGRGFELWLNLGDAA